MQPTDGMIVKMTLANPGIGDEAALPGQPDADPLRDAGEEGGERRANGAVEDPYFLKTTASEQRHQADKIDAALQFRPGMLEIESFGNGRLRGKQFARAAGGRGEKRHLSAGRYGGNGADEGQVPNDIANPGLGLNDRVRRWGPRTFHALTRRRYVFGKLSSHTRDHAVPVAERSLAEQARGRVPGARLAIERPAPVGRERDQHPERPAHGAGKVRHRGVGGDD